MSNLIIVHSIAGTSNPSGYPQMAFGSAIGVPQTGDFIVSNDLKSRIQVIRRQWMQDPETKAPLLSLTYGNEEPAN
ncbi:MAG: hypothetical protein PGN26_14485 [Xylophilus ampelinus]